MKAIYENLLELKDVTEQLKGLLLQDDMDLVLNKLAERQKLLDKLQGILSMSDNKSRKSSISETRMLIKSILSLDHKNKKEVKIKISDLSNSLSYLRKEKHSLKRLRSETKVRHKRIVDILY